MRIILPEGSLNDSQEPEAAYTLRGTDPQKGRTLSSSVEAPLPIGDSSGHERSPLEALSLPDGATVRPELIKRPQPTGKPAAASILTEGSLNDRKRVAKVTK